MDYLFHSLYGEYREGHGIYIKIPLGFNKYKEFVIPGKVDNSDTWNYGTKMHNKYITIGEDKV